MMPAFRKRSEVMRHRIFLAITLLGALSIGACESSRVATRTGEALDRAGTRTGEALGRAADATGQAVVRAGDWVRDRTQ